MATKDTPVAQETITEAVDDLVELPNFSDDQLTSVELTKTQQNTINDLRKVMKPSQVDDLIKDFKKANLVKQQSGEKRLRAATTEFTKEHAIVYAQCQKKDANLTEIATAHGMEVTAIPNVIREIKSKLFTVLVNEGQISKEAIAELLQKHATAEPRKKRDKKVEAGANGITDNSGENDDDDNNDDDDDGEGNGVAPTFTPEELAALESAD